MCLFVSSAHYQKFFPEVINKSNLFVEHIHPPSIQARGPKSGRVFSVNRIVLSLHMTNQQKLVCACACFVCPCFRHRDTIFHATRAHQKKQTEKIQLQSLLLVLFVVVTTGAAPDAFRPLLLFFHGCCWSIWLHKTF